MINRKRKLRCYGFILFWNIERFPIRLPSSKEIKNFANFRGLRIWYILTYLLQISQGIWYILNETRYQYLWTYIFYFLSFICTLCNVWVHINCTYDIHYSNISSYTSDQKHELGQFLWLHIFIRHRVYRKPIHISSNNNNVQLKTFLYLFVFVTMFFFIFFCIYWVTLPYKRKEMGGV